MSILFILARPLELLLYALAALGLLGFWLFSFGVIYLSALLSGGKESVPIRES